MVEVESWMTAYKEKLAELVLSKGKPAMVDFLTPTEISFNYYGWTNYDLYWHFTDREKLYDDTDRTEACTAYATPDSTILEHRESQFVDTDFSGNDVQEFVVLTGVNCACGKHKDMIWAWEGSRSEAILAVTR